MPLQQLDERLVPHIRDGLRGFGRALGSPLRSLAHWEQRLARGRPFRALWRNRQVLLLGAALIAFAGSYIHLQRYEDVRDRAAAADAPVSGATGADLPTEGTLAGGAVAVGPTVGTDLRAYAEDRRAELAAADPRDLRVAVVSFAGYRTGAESAALIPEAAEVLAVQIRVPAEGEQPSTLDVTGGDLAATVEEAVAAEVARLRDEEEELGRLLESGTVEDPAFADVYRADLDRIEATRNLLLAAGAGVVFAVVVEAEVAVLQELAEGDPVRLVDLAPAETDVTQSEFHGLLPEDEDEASVGVLG